MISVASKLKNSSMFSRISEGALASLIENAI